VFIGSNIKKKLIDKKNVLQEVSSHRHLG